MPEENNNEQPVEDEQQPQDAPQEGDNDDALPEWAKKKISDLNAESASWRTKFRDAEQKLANAKTPEDFAAAAAEFATQRTALERELVIAKAGLPEELHEFVTGTTQEELETSAAKLAKFVKPEPKQPAPKGDLNGGLNKRDDDDSGNAVAASVARIRAARSAI